MMNADQRLQLQKMVTTHGAEDMTDLIRELRHSSILREQSGRLVEIKAQYETSDRDVLSDAFQMDAMTECNFLFTYYTDVYNKIRKDELDLTVWYKALDVLRDIEDGKLDQHEGSYRFGVLLKEMYVDSALRKAAKLEAETRQGGQEQVQQGGEPAAAEAKTGEAAAGLTWADFKRQQQKTQSGGGDRSDGAALEKAYVQARLLEKQRRLENARKKYEAKNKKSSRK